MLKSVQSRYSNINGINGTRAVISVSLEYFPLRGPVGNVSRGVPSSKHVRERVSRVDTWLLAIHIRVATDGIVVYDPRVKRGAVVTPSVRVMGLKMKLTRYTIADALAYTS